MTDAPTIISSRSVYQGHTVSIRVDELRLSSGERREREIVQHPGSATILPILDTGEVVLVRQFRASLGRFVLELPAGTRESGEDASTCAARELEEETGYIAGTIERLGSCHFAPGFLACEGELFVARGLTTGHQSSQDATSIRVSLVPFDTCIEFVRDGTISDAKSIIALLRYHLFYRGLND